MNKLIISLAITLVSSTAFAAEMCPKSINIANATYTPPAGWHVTNQKLDAGSKELLFFIATYNFDQKVGNNDHRISCVYKDRKNDYVLEITTDKNNYPLPSSSLWEALDSGSNYCFPSKPLDPTDCPWG